MENWENISYQTINNASLREQTVTVCFENGDEVSFHLNALLPFIDPTSVINLNQHALQFSSYDIHIKISDREEVSIPWDKIRVLTDKEFSRFMASKAEEQAKLIGVKLKILREKKGIRSNDLADRSGVTAQTISRIEKGHTDVGFSTLKKLLASMGYSLKDLANQELEVQMQTSEEKSYNLLLKNLVRAGVDTNLLIKRIIPENIHNALKVVNKKQPVLLLNEAASYVSTVFGWSLEDIWSGTDLQVSSKASAEALFKMPGNVNINQIKAYAHYGYYLANVAIKACSNVESKYPEDTESFKTALLKKYGNLDLESILRFAWELGIIVLPLNDSGLFHGASWNIEGRHVIIVKQNTKYHSRWIFDLLHELYHVFDHLQEINTSVIEATEISPFASDESLQEREANSFANLVLFDGKAEEYAQECVETANWNLSSLSAKVKKVAKQKNVREDNLANYIAFRLSFQHQNWWAQASSFQVSEPHPFTIAINVLKEKISLNKLNPIESNLLKMAMDS